MAAICAFLPSTSVIASRGIVALPNRSAQCRGANRRSPPWSRQRLGKANALTLGRKSTLTNPRGWHRSAHTRVEDGRLDVDEALAVPTMDGPQRPVLGQRRAYGVVGGGDGDADHALTATFRYFVGFHSRAIRCASAI
jgi:hypothetical protein